MATSGTVATTTVNTATLIEHALLRVKVPLSSQTPEVLGIARESLYMLMLGMSNNGLNLWCVDKGYLGLTAGQATYSLPSGTLDVLNVSHSAPTILDSTFAAVANGGEAELDATAASIRLGYYFSAAYTGALTLASSSDGVTYTTLTTLASATYAAGVWYYTDLPISTSALYFRITGAAAPVSNIRVISVSYDLPLTQWNRDTYIAINNKEKQSHPATNYFFEKKITQTLTLWPVPDSDENYLIYYRHRQIQDVGSLIQELEIPARWLEGIVWQLALRLAFELPQVDPQLIQVIAPMAEKYEFEAELGETDGAPIYLTPTIRGYTR